MKYLIILSLVFSANSFAVTPIKEGQKSPETGYIFSQSEEKQVRGINEKRLKLEDLAVKQEELNKVQTEKIKLQEDQISNLQIEINKTKFTTTQRVIYFGLGILATGLAISLANKVTK